MKAVIPVAWYGTRMLPVTKSIPKELLPVGNKPVLQYLVEGLTQVDIKNICMITAQGKHAIEDYFDKNYELEEVLKKKWKIELLNKINKTKDMANICYVKQKKQLGFPHAVLEAKPWINTDYFLLVVGDQIYSPQIFQDMVDMHNQYKQPIVLLQKIPLEQVYKYGVADVQDGKIVDMVEKPKPSKAPSNLIMPGMYILPKEIFGIIEQTPINEDKWEIVLPDVLDRLMDKMDIVPCVTENKIRDLGNPQDWLQANVEFAESGLF